MPARDVCCEQPANVVLLVFFFFQAEDGIRDLTVTGVQTCALPIFRNRRKLRVFLSGKPLIVARTDVGSLLVAGFFPIRCGRSADTDRAQMRRLLRSEEHTSELQSQSNLVCRLLLEKKKNDRSYPDL